MSPIRVVLGEGNLLVRTGLQAVLQAEPDVEIVAVCASIDELLEAVESLAPDLVLTDVRVPSIGDGGGLRLTNGLQQLSAGVGVLVVSQVLDAVYAMELMAQAGRGRGYLLVERLGNPQHLIDAIRAVADGGSVIDPAVVDALVESRRRNRSALSTLTPREQEILTHVAAGRSNSAIAAQLFITDRAVEKHINSIFAKLGLGTDRGSHRRVKAVLIYLAEGGSS